MKKFKKCFLMVLLIACFAMPLFTGCDFLLSSSSKLKTPVVTISESNKSLTWSKISGAESYEIYCNGALADEIDATKSAKAMYDYSSTLTETGKYSYYVIATTSSIYKQNSEKSNVCETNYTKKILITPDTPEAEFQDEKINFTINDGVISYMPLDIENIDYEVYLYSSSSGLKTYPLSSSVLNLKQGSYLTKDEIYAVRLGYSYLGADNTKKHIIASDIKYYNPDSYSPYTDQIYMFDGYINDYYIESIQELSNIVYYSFIYRLETFNIKISDEFKEFISNAFGYSTTIDNLNYAVKYGFNQLYETIAYDGNNINKGFASQNGTPNEFTIKITYGGVAECDITISPTASAIFSQSRTTGYYDTVDYETLGEKYGDTYDDFVSDKQFLYTPVTTSEELYWAVENKITPVFEKTNTRAYTIYQKAKQVLREIISDEMTDYEKALSIFDWIAINSKYDYTNYNAYSELIAKFPTKLPCFYLEGVFMTGNSVCDGFSKSYSLLCNMIGVDCIRIVGDAGTVGPKGGHAWNKVLFDKNLTDDIPAKYYLVDITWTEMISNDGEEALSHTYFGLSDEQVKDSHLPYKNREVKFAKYASNESLNYYTYQTFNYKGTDEDLVITNYEELQDAFDYLLINAYDSLELVMDYDFMVTDYNENSTTGDYLSQTDIEITYYDAKNFVDNQQREKTKYDPSTDTFTYYYYEANTFFGSIVGYTQKSETYYNYKLKQSFMNTMKKAKFPEQYLIIADNEEIIEYETGETGILYVFEQNLLIDNLDSNKNYADEIPHLVNYFSENKITGTYVLYVENSMLNGASGTTEIDKVQSLFESALSTANIEMSFEFVSNDEDLSDSTASVFNLVVTEKTA